MVYGHNTTAIHYRIINESRHPAALHIYPLVTAGTFTLPSLKRAGRSRARLRSANHRSFFLK
jgi:hypothetical protein